MKFTKKIGILLLSIWLILTGLVALVDFSLSGLPGLMGALAIAAGIFILMDR